MVGDGINDAAVLKAADVSFAMGEGAALAQLHADCVLMSGRLSSLADAAAVARALGVVRQNLAWATLYNALAIPAAALGLINPWVSAVGMSASSALVVINALRLRLRGSEMEALYLLVPLSLCIVVLAVWVFFGASDSGQFDDLDGPAIRILNDDDRA
ncbi:cbb3-type cytochrome oxidase assembly protein CcoS [Massilia sp. B-10]|nr:cbb3-type cytochrome oxidase assembly protein CcoS [Massilia sp. B-10]